MSQAAVVVFLYFGMYFHQISTLDEMDRTRYEAETDQTDWASRVVGFGTADRPVAIMIAVVFTFLTVLLTVSTYQATAHQEVPILKLMKSNVQPELMLEKDKQYHVFLSHTWRSGQDQVCNIKHKLQLMLPGCQIFLEYAPRSNRSF